MSDTLHVSTRKGLFTLTRDAGGAWSVSDVAFLGVNTTLSHTDADGTTWAALDHGHFGVKLHRRDAGGEWEELTAPAFPEGMPADPAPEPAEGQDAPPAPSPPSVSLLWALARGAGDTLWCGTIPGALFRSDDRGASWQLNEALWARPERLQWFGGGFDKPGIHSICVDPRDPRRIALGVSCGGVWLSEDDGAGWDMRSEGLRAEYMPPERAFDPTIQDPHMLVQCAASPEHLWVQHHNGIFRCADDLQSWQEIADVQPSVFGFGVAVHPADPDTAWFVPAVKDELRVPADAALVVTRTRDGGETFEVLREGLPQRDAYDIVLRHALDVSADGERLAFGSTTGGLWVSEDQGDSWREAAAHLPPIHAVRFA